MLSPVPGNSVKKKRWNLEFDIPKSIKLPGVTIQVKCVSPSEEDKVDNNHGMWQYNVDTDRAVIYVDKDAPIEHQRYVLLHELLHAIHELLDVGICEYPEFVQPTVKAEKALPLAG